MISSNLINSNDEMMIEIRQDIFGKRTRRKIYRIKNHSVWIDFAEKSSNEHGRNF